MTRRLTELERRLDTLEEQTEAAEPWHVAYIRSLSEEQFEEEVSWLFPRILRDWVRGGSPGYPNADGGGLAQHPDIAPLWQRWHAAYHRVVLDVCMGRLPPDSHRDLYDLWSGCHDPEQESIRLQLRERLRSLLPPPVAELLTEWQPSSPASCTTDPSPAFFAWRDARKLETRKVD